MNIQRGMTGSDVVRIQQRLKALKFYAGPVDGDFGGGSEGSLKSFQLSIGRTATGVVDAGTWDALFPGVPPPVSALASAPLGTRCLALTGSFETGAHPPDCFCGITGDFDGMGISFGALQWNLGQKTLQPLLADAVRQHEDICRSIFHEHLDTMMTLGGESLEEQLRFARSIQTPSFQVIEPWRGMLKALGYTPEFQAIQTARAAELSARALGLCGDFGLTSRRAAALMFDALTQNGGVRPLVKSQILADFTQLSATGEDLEVARMRIIANRVAASARAQYVDDVRVRKLTIAEGRGIVHGIPYDLDNVFGLTLAPFA
jgi:hypothetical protein